MCTLNILENATSSSFDRRTVDVDAIIIIVFHPYTHSFFS